MRVPFIALGVLAVFTTAAGASPFSEAQQDVEDIAGGSTNNVHSGAVVAVANPALGRSSDVQLERTLSENGEVIDSHVLGTEHEPASVSLDRNAIVERRFAGISAAAQYQKRQAPTTTTTSTSTTSTTYPNRRSTSCKTSSTILSCY